MQQTDVQKIRPLGDLVIVRRHKEEIRLSGIILRESLEGLQKGTVVAIGKGRLLTYSPKWERNKWWCDAGTLVKVGDVVLFLEGIGQPLRFVKDRFVTDASDRQYMIMHEEHIAGVLEHDE